MLSRPHLKQEEHMEEYFEYLEQLRESGVVNMFGAVPYLQAEFPELAHDKNRAREILQAWMDSYKEGGQ